MAQVFSMADIVDIDEASGSRAEVIELGKDAYLAAPQHEEVALVAPGTVTELVKCVEDLQDHVAFVVARLSQLEAQMQQQYVPVPTMQEPLVADLTCYGDDIQGLRVAVTAAFETQQHTLTMQAQEIEDLKAAVNCLSMNFPGSPTGALCIPTWDSSVAVSQNFHAEQPSVPDSMAMESMLSEDSTEERDGDEAAGCVSPSFPSPTFSVTEAPDGFGMITELSLLQDESCAVLEPAHRRDLSKVSTPPICQKPARTYFDPEPVEDNLMKDPRWSHPDEAVLAAALDVVDKLAQEKLSPDTRKSYLPGLSYEAIPQYTLPRPSLRGDAAVQRCPVTL